MSPVRASNVIPRSDTGRVSFRHVTILGVPVHDVTYDEAVAAIAGVIAHRGRVQVTTPNPEFIMQARRDAPFRRVLQDSWLNVPDGVGLLLAAWWQGRPLREQVRGTDLIEALARHGAPRGWRFFFLGAAPGVAELAAARLARRHPGLVVAGTYGGSPRPVDDAATVAAVQAAAPVDVLLVAYGAPGQDLWISRNLPRLDVRVAIGVGGALDFLSGRVRRAPLWMRRAGLEWLYRLVRQPWRWRRQRVLPVFAVLAAAEALRLRLVREHRA
ncbi:MAG: acetylglucosaminyldiphospho-UDP acetyl-beta-D-mannosaminyltransferase [Chloroflexota bacterium]